MFNETIEQFIVDFVQELEAGNAAIFAGAGLSATVGYVNWIELMKPFAIGLGLDAEKESHDLVALAQYHVNSEGQNRGALHRRLLQEFAIHASPSDSHKVLARLPIPVYWTTNYDRLIEHALEGERRIPDVKFRTQQLAHSVPRRDAVVYKMHGDVEHPDEAVLTKDDYESYESQRGPFITALKGDLVSRTFLFIGFSFTDPNLEYVLSRIRINFDRKNHRRHYALFRHVNRASYKSDADFEYARAKQAVVVEDLKRFAIKVLLVDEYAQIPQILHRIESTYRRKTVFVSGSAESFGTWSQSDVEEMLSNLGRALVQRGFRLVSGFGLGISNALLSGATDTIYNNRLGRFEDFLTVRPFPRYIDDPTRRAELWDQFRRDLISRAGLALVMFGNKSDKGTIVLAGGVRKEFEIARELGLDVAPIGATGYMAAELADELLRDSPPAHAAALRNLQIEPDRPQELVEPILQLLDELTKL